MVISGRTWLRFPQEGTVLVKDMADGRILVTNPQRSLVTKAMIDLCVAETTVGGVNWGEPFGRPRQIFVHLVKRPPTDLGKLLCLSSR